MDEERLEQELRAYFQEEVEKVEPPNEWWDQTISRLSESKRSSRCSGLLPKTRLAWTLASVLILLLVGGTVYGASSVIREFFWKHVEEPGLTQVLDLSQTIDGVTVRLERAYADANVVLAGFTVSGPDERYYTDYVLKSDSDHNIPMMMGVGIVPGSDILHDWQPSERIAVVAAFDASTLETALSTLNLQLTVRVSDSSDLDQNQAITGPFVFNFSVPFYAGKVIQLNQTVEAVSTAVTLERIIISPWATRTVLRLSSAEAGRPVPIVTLQLPNGDSQNGVFSRDSGDSSWQYMVGNFTDQPGEWVLTVKELVFPPVSPKAGPHPASDIKRLAGPWVFHFQVP